MVLLWNAHNWMRLISVALYIHTLMDNTKVLCLWTTCLWSRIWGSFLKMNKQCTYHLPSKICLLCFLSANASNAGWFVMMFTRLLGWCTGAQRLIPCLVTISWGTRKFQGTNVLVTKEIYTNVHDFVQEVSLKLSPNMTNLRSASGGGQMCLIWQKKRYQCPRSAHKSFSMRRVFHLW